MTSHNPRWTRPSCLVLLASAIMACAQPVYESDTREADRRPDRPSLAPSDTAGSQLCQPCETSEECGGPEDLCLADMSGMTYCTSQCVSDVDCPEGFLCSPIHGGTSKQCVPGSGRCDSGSELGGGEPGSPEPGSEPVPEPGGESLPQPAGGSGGAPDPGSTGGTGGTSPGPAPEPTPATGGSGGQPQSMPDGINALCFGVCFTGLYTECTCHISDPCGWSNDGFCDDTCAMLFPAAHFDDGPDCVAAPPSGGEGCEPPGTGGTGGEWEPPGTGGTGGESTPPCGGSCDLGYYDGCTCSAADPCGWSNDGYCDDACDEVSPTDRFEDGLDCGY